METDDQAIWIGTQQGINILTNNKIEDWNLSNTLPSQQVNTIQKIQDYIYIGTTNGLSIYNCIDSSLTSTFLNQNIQSISHHPYWGIVVVANHRLYSISKEGKIETNSLGVKEQNFLVNTLYISPDSTLYIGCNKGLIQIDPLTKKIWKKGVKYGLLTPNVTGIIEDKFKTLWVGTSNGLFYKKGDFFESVHLGKHSFSNHILKLETDWNGQVWIGTDYGFFVANKSKFELIGAQYGVKSQYIFQVKEDGEGNIWIATRDYGLYKKTGNVYHNFNTNHGLPTNNLYCFLFHKDKMLIGSNIGLITKTKKGYKAYNGKYASLYKSIYSIDKYKDSIVIGATGVVVVMTPYDTIEIKSNFHPRAQFWALNLCKKGKITAGAYLGGIFKTRNKHLKQINKVVKISDEHCLAIQEDPYDGIWYATFNGIYHVNDQGNTTNISQNDGLSSNLVYTLILDKRNKSMWIGTNQGLSKLKLDDFHQKGEINIKSYSYQDGLFGVEANCHGTYIASDSTLYVGTVNGLYNSDVLITPLKSHPPELYFDRFLIGFQDTNLTGIPVLSHSIPNLSFTFKTIDFSADRQLQYQYRLIGNDSSWSPVFFDPYVNFNHLSPGKYKLEIKAVNSDGIESSKTLSKSFVISPPYYYTFYFWFILIIVLSSLIYAIVTYRLKQIRRRNELAQKVEQFKLQMLRSQMNPHFIYNSLNSIQHYINNNEKREANKYLSKFARLMRSILNNSRVPLISLSDELSSLQLYVELEQLRFEGKFDFELEVADQISKEEDMIPPMILQPMIENAIIHGFKGIKYKGIVRLEISKHQNFLLCKIHDNGIGMKASDLQKSKSKLKHNSAGMSITKSRIKVLNQFYKQNLSIIYNDSTIYDTGTTVLVTIPFN